MDTTQLYDALGELIYAVAKVDGLVQDTEISKLKEVLENHPWSNEIKWSFDYENRKENTPDEAFAKALQTCKDFGPSAEYAFVIEVLQAVSEASDGTSVQESGLIDRFQQELTGYFQRQ
ncbi:MAG TPA: hypothetical protein PLC89_14155 [Haliscomenobacter sp.]|uniref:hypothetical protein n=1 Tax=Haliscomenobacter sp. TaxID=2717303 RepID=UPI001D5B6A29|nr:hypothetical protein [Haliscomenobacter sp.]MBK9489917.1 TerB family tellurite resistance protein [Haliscomenobacter sp.]HOY18445.1 hypothetical protein [Haliscomenobacter sp.]HPH19320.1 hypothetical protein [Haliscomenobacter sp.]